MSAARRSEPRGGKQLAVRARRKLTPAVVAAICERVRDGSLLGAACKLEGVTTEALRLARHADDDIAAQVDAALGALEEIHRKHLADAEDWRAHHQILRAIDRETWGEPKDAAPPAAPAGASMTLTLPLSDLRELARMGSAPARAMLSPLEVKVATKDGDE